MVEIGPVGRDARCERQGRDEVTRSVYLTELTSCDHTTVNVMSTTTGLIVQVHRRNDGGTWDE